MKEKTERRSYKVHGIERWLSQKEIEENFERLIPKKWILPETFELAEKPTNGKCYQIQLQKIDKSLFLEERENRQEERMRGWILKGLTEALKKPEKYECFYLLIPMKSWVYRDKEAILPKDAVDFAEKIGGCIPTYIEVVLEWAQRITSDDGSDKIWERVCNKFDRHPYNRLFIGIDGEFHVVGRFDYGYSDTDFYIRGNHTWLRSEVPYVKLKTLDCPPILFY